VLLVEDNPGDVRLVREAFSRRPRPPDIVHAADGLAALEYLRGDAERPDLILLDLNLPRMDGREFLAVAKRDAELRRIPVVVLSSSASDADVDRLYDLNANGYLIKPRGLAEIGQPSVGTRSDERDIDAFCKIGYGGLLAKFASGLQVQLATPARRDSVSRERSPTLSRDKATCRTVLRRASRRRRTSPQPA
jgi:CheY-like chemotaxis protein